jgi:conjugal transfer pilus assembly protein TraW
LLQGKLLRAKHLLLLGLLLHGLAQADEDWLSRSQRILSIVQAHERPAWLDSNPYQTDAKLQAQQFLGAPEARIKTNLSDKPVKPLRLVFVSFSLGTSALKGLFADASGQADVLLVLRGPKPGQTLSHLLAELKPLLKGLEPVPHIVIDPTRFQKWQVTSVPEMVIEHQGQLQLRVKGVTSLEWFKAQQAISRQGDLGQQGDVYDIAEIDLLAEIKRRLAAIDGPKQQQQAIARFWQTRQFEILPTAQKDRDRLIDLTVTAPRDLLAPNGQLIIPAGQTLNPLEKMAFGLCLRVFDATDKAQVNGLAQFSCQNKSARLMYLATQLPRTEGWDGLKSLETQLHAPVYLLTADVKQRFQLQAVPALVEQTGNQVVVRERKVNPSVTAMETQP